MQELLSFFTVSRYLFLPLDAVANGISDLKRCFAFNLTILGMVMAISVVLAWLVMESYVVWQKRWR